MRWSTHSGRLVFPFGLLIALLVGCGSKGQPCSVSGAVKYGGTPIHQGSIRFEPVDANLGVGVATQITSGSYEIPLDRSLMAGNYMVMIFATKETGNIIKAPEWLSGKPIEPYKEVVQYIPANYNANTKLQVELKPGENNDTNFDLQVGLTPTVVAPDARP